MNVNKSEVKMAVAQDIGKQFEAREAAMVAESHRLEGAKGALKQAADKLDSVKVFYQKEVDEDKFEEKDLELVMKAIDRCRGVLLSLADVAQTQMLIKQGEAREAKMSLDLIEKIYHDERSKLAKILEGIENGTVTKEDMGRAVDGSPTIRVVDGGRPTTDAAADLAARRAAARAEREGKTEVVPQVSPTEPPPVPEEKAPEPAARAEPATPQESTKSPIPPPKRQVVSRRQKS